MEQNNNDIQIQKTTNHNGTFVGLIAIAILLAVGGIVLFLIPNSPIWISNLGQQEKDIKKIKPLLKAGNFS